VNTRLANAPKYLTHQRFTYKIYKYDSRGPKGGYSLSLYITAINHQLFNISRGLGRLKYGIGVELIGYSQAHQNQVRLKTPISYDKTH
jgi:hypothetical protein